jgi:hypothetical protein
VLAPRRAGPRPSLGRKVPCEGDEALEEVFHVRAVIAEERDEEERAPCELIERDRPPRYGIGERKARRRGAKAEHAGFSSCQCVLLPSVLMSPAFFRLIYIPASRAATLIKNKGGAVATLFPFADSHPTGFELVLQP